MNGQMVLSVLLPVLKGPKKDSIALFQRRWEKQLSISGLTMEHVKPLPTRSMKMF
jgi:hypothetical protein